MEEKENKIKKTLIWLIIISTVIRAFIAYFIELGNDEVYYWTYALYPDWSHFDHPPMVGFIIQMFSFNLLFQDEIFLRLSSIIFGSINTWLIFLIAKKLKNSITGLYAALLFTASIYCFVIAGIFILPDTPQVLFWLLSMYFLLNSLPDKSQSKKSRNYLLLAGVTIGLGMLSKYTSVFLWFGAGLYILFYNRNWLKSKTIYLSVLVSLILVLPIFIWNIQNDFISFTYQGERVDVSGSMLRLDYFATEFFGQIFYNNPVNFVIIIFALVAIIRKKKFLNSQHVRLLLFLSLPLIFTFLVFSLFRSTLPHWSGLAYLSLILIAAAYLEELSVKKLKKVLFPVPIQFSLYFLLIILIFGVGQINYGWLNIDKSTNVKILGKNDFSLDMYGWEQLGEKFSNIVERDKNQNLIDTNAVIISYRWFPAANLDYYVARQLNKKVLAIGSLERIHKYAWINKKRGGFYKGMDAYFITTSRDFKNPYDLYENYFEKIEPADTIPIIRNSKNVKNFFVFRMIDLQRIPAK